LWSAFAFTGQTVWARQLNAEYADPEVVNDGGRVWIMGFKTEGPWTCFMTRNGGRTEILGGVLNIGNDRQDPAIVVDESHASVVASTGGNMRSHRWPIAVREVCRGVERTATQDQFPRRHGSQYTISLYTA